LRRRGPYQAWHATAGVAGGGVAPATAVVAPTISAPIAPSETSARLVKFPISTIHASFGTDP